MQLRWYRPTLERVSHVAFIVMCVAVTAVGVQRFSDARTTRDGTVAPAPFQPGTRLALPASLEAQGARGSVLLALSTNCQYCTASMPFYRRLRELDAVRAGALKLAVISLQPETQMREYLRTHDAGVDTIVTFADSGISIRGTPTLILVNARGEVVRSWTGQLRSDEEAEFVKALNGLVRP